MGERRGPSAAMVVRGFRLVRAETRRVGVELVGERSGGAGFTCRIGRVHRALALEPSVDSDLGRAAEMNLGHAVGPGLLRGRRPLGSCRVSLLVSVGFAAVSAGEVGVDGSFAGAPGAVGSDFGF